jgi:hypothetical protein
MYKEEYLFSRMYIHKKYKCYICFYNIISSSSTIYVERFMVVLIF